MNDAYRLLPYADILYACDEHWWQMHIADVERSFFGERWTTHQAGPSIANDKSQLPPEWRLNCAAGKESGGFSTDRTTLHYGGNSGFQAINLALLKGATRVVLVGFDMRVVAGARHFFGDHPEPLSNAADYRKFVRHFERAARECRVPIVNATPGSALDCFERVDLDDEIAAFKESCVA